MSVPYQRKTKSQRDKRRMHIYTEAPALTLCSHCGKPKRPHTVCKNCGYYKGEEVINVLGKLEKKEKKKREKEIKEKEKGGEEKKKESPTMEDLSQKKF